MAAGAGREASGAFSSFGGNPGDAGELEVEGLVLRPAPLVQQRRPIRAQALLRQRSQLRRQLFSMPYWLPLSFHQSGV